MQKDILIRGLLFDKQARFTAVSGRDLVAEAKRIHDTSATCTAALGRTLLGTVILASLEKGDAADVTVRIQGDGPASPIVCVADHNGTTKGYIKDPHIELPQKPNGKLDVSGAVGNEGRIVVIRDSGMGEPYIGQADLLTGEIAEDFAAYLAFSQQEPSMLYLGVHISKEFEVSAATGVLVQLLPDCDEDTITQLEQLSGKMYTLSDQIEFGATLEEAIADIFAEGNPEFLNEMPIQYQCDCSVERIEKALITLGPTELQAIIDEDGQAEVKCHFCDKVYQFDKKQLETLLQASQS